MPEKEKADWQAVGSSFRDLGDQLAGHAREAGTAMSSASADAEGVLEEVTGAVKAAFARFDDATKDPAVGQAARTATARFLDALKVELTGSSQTPPS